MRYREIAPPSVLSHIVRYFWIIESDEDPQTRSTYRLFAESSPGLVFFYHHNCGIVSGLTETHREFDMSGSLGMVGAYLYPYAIPILFRETPEKLSNTTLEISEFLGNEGERLKDQVMNSRSNDQRVVVIGKYLLEKIHKASEREGCLHAGIREIVSRNGSVSVDALVTDLGFSARHFDRKFLSAVGIPPKIFSRLIRFQSTLQLSNKMCTRNLTELAMNAGYYDQSHFIREFKEFSGLSPSAYFKMRPHDIADNFVRLSA